MWLVVGTALLLAAAVCTLETNSSSRRADPYACATRKIHDHFNDHGYLFTWEDPNTEHLELSWPEAREFCRTRCMELVSLETKAENEFIKQHIDKGHVPYVWTSGRKCNFAACDRPDLKPVNVYGWFWTGTLQKMPPTTNRIDTDWSNYGGIGRPQPDNREYIQGGAEEECMAILNNLHDDGIKWHDIACHHRKPFICEDSDVLLHAAHLPHTDQQYEVANTYVQYQMSTTTRKTHVEQEPPPPDQHDINMGLASSEKTEGLNPQTKSKDQAVQHVHLAVKSRSKVEKTT